MEELMRYFDPHCVMECTNPESLFYLNDNEPVFEATASLKMQTYYPVYIFVCHTGTLLSSLIQLYTKDQYSHSLLSFDASMTKMYSFGRKKLNENEIVSGKSNGFAIDDINNDFYTSWKNRIRFATYVIFVTEKDRKRMMKRVEYFVDNSVKFSYDLTGLIKYAMHVPSEKQFSYFCSGFVADVLQTGNVLGDKRHYSLYSPQDLSELPMAYKVNEGNDFSEYREYKTKAKVKSAWNKFINESQLDPDHATLVLV